MIALMLAAALASPPLPDDQVTPGVDNPAVTQETIRKTICVPNWTATVRPPASYTNALKDQQLRARGDADQNPKDFEEDHRLSIEDGGDPRDPRNLWPMTYKGDWNARVKDKLETADHRAICSGAVTLEQGRAILKGDWISAFKRYCGPTPAAKCKITAP